MPWQSRGPLLHALEQVPASTLGTRHPPVQVMVPLPHAVLHVVP